VRKEVGWKWHKYVDRSRWMLFTLRITEKSVQFPSGERCKTILSECSFCWLKTIVVFNTAIISDCVKIFTWYTLLKHRCRPCQCIAAISDIVRKSANIFINHPAICGPLTKVPYTAVWVASLSLSQHRGYQCYYNLNNRQNFIIVLPTIFHAMFEYNYCIPVIAE
jgi:hypothetical protein